MNIGLIIGVVGGVVGAVGIIYTVYYGRRSQRKKLMVYEVSKAVALAQAFSPEGDYKLSVLFQRKGSVEERIESVYTRFLKFANLGKESIRGSDIAPGNPLRVIVKGDRVLDIQLAGVTRNVNNVSLTNQVLGDKGGSADISFDFLDCKDGGLIKILSVGNQGGLALEGDIIGMPEGINNIDNLRQRVNARNITGRLSLAAGLIVASLILSVFIGYWRIGNWGDTWLIFVPFGVFVILTILFVIGAEIVLALRGGLSFPSSLAVPRWAVPFAYPIEIRKVGSLRGALSKTVVQEKGASMNDAKGGEDKKG
jgi:hypothetical protein